MRRFIAMTFAALALAACEQRDNGADMAACNLDEMKSNYPDKDRTWKEFARAVAERRDSKSYLEMMREDRSKFLRFCMRAKGWDVKSETSCIQVHADQANCYVPASGIGE